MSFLNIVTKIDKVIHKKIVHYDKAEIISRLQDWFHAFKKINQWQATTPVPHMRRLNVSTPS